MVVTSALRMVVRLVGRMGVRMVVSLGGLMADKWDIVMVG